MNRKGFFAPYVAVPLLVAFIVAMVTRPQHVEKRYIEKCVKSGLSLTKCGELIESLSLQQRIEYIRDVKTGPTTQNFTHR